MINRVTSCLPSLIVGRTGCCALSTAAAGRATLARTVAPVVSVAVCLRNCLRLFEPLLREDIPPSLLPQRTNASAVTAGLSHRLLSRGIPNHSVQMAAEDSVSKTERCAAPEEGLLV